MCDTEESVENNGLTSELVQLEMAINEETSLRYPFCAPPLDDDVAEALLEELGANRPGLWEAGHRQRLEPEWIQDKDV